MQQDSAKLARDLMEYMRRHRHSQVQVAGEAGVDQSTVSRWLKKPPQRHTGAHYRLCNYAETVLSGSGGGEQKEAVRKAFDEVWNKSHAHATAISKIINAFAELCRRDHSEEDQSA